MVGAAPVAGIDPYYQGYFDNFNRGLYYEAHDVLEQIWLKDRHGINGAFYKGLIQLAGALVHLQKQRMQPACSLLKLASANLALYEGTHEHLDVLGVLAFIEHWIAMLQLRNFQVNPLREEPAPILRLEVATPAAESGAKLQ